MILIADSGSTKTDWCIVEHGQLLRRVNTGGTNPFFQSEEEIKHEIETSLLPHLPSKRFEAVHFYGAGCAFPDKIESVRRAIAAHLEVEQEIEVSTDMLAAARGLCAHSPGIACIMGTGSNSCYYDGKEIVQNVSPLGFILGDEGSGAVLGKLFIGSLLKNQMPAGLKETFLEKYDLTPADIIDRVYRKPFPNRFLASLSPFLVEHLHIQEIHDMVYQSFIDFFKRNVMQYDYSTFDVHFVGSVAYYYQDILKEAAREIGIRIGQIEKSPMPGLIHYHETL
ncbi:MAG: ATPase [Bacteroides sp.]